MKSVTDIIPEEDMEPGHVSQVLDFLKAAPLVGNEKERILIVWSHEVGAKVSAAQRAAVRNSGIDNR